MNGRTRGNGGAPQRRADLDAYFRSISEELRAVRNRVRHLIGTAHWPTDGAWKESILRSAIGGKIGSRAIVGQGFFLADGHASPQIDVLLYRSDAPVLFRDGSLVIVPANAVLALVEVKSRLTITNFRESVQRLAHARALLRHAGFNRTPVTSGVFGFESSFRSPEGMLGVLSDAGRDREARVDLVCSGPNRLVRYWEHQPGTRAAGYERWHSYKMKGMSFGYFIHAMCQRSADGVRLGSREFFPAESKERFVESMAWAPGSLAAWFAQYEEGA